MALAPGVLVGILAIAIYLPSGARLLAGDEHALEVLRDLCVHGAFYANVVVAVFIGTDRYSSSLAIKMVSFVLSLVLAALLVVAAWWLSRRRRQVVAR